MPGFLALVWASASPGLLFLAIPVGMALWGWVGWVVGWLSFRWILPYLLVAELVAIGWIIRRYRSGIVAGMRKFRPSVDRVSMAIIIVGSIVQGLMVWNTFVGYRGTIATCCGDPNDMVWYASITQSLRHTFPPENPGLAGTTLQNYHYWWQMTVADILRLFPVNPYLLQFRYYGILVSLFLGVSTLALVKAIRGSDMFSRWLLFFFYFGGDFLYGIVLVVHRVWMFPGSSLEDGVRLLGNPQRGIAVVLGLSWLALWLSWYKTMSVRRIVVLGLVLSSIIGFKVYVGMFLYMGLLAVAAYDAFRKKYDTILLVAVSGILGVMVYLPVNAGAGGLFYTGFWRFENFIMQPGLALDRLELARVIFANDGKMLKALCFDLLYIAVYILAIFGTKAIGLLQTKRSIRLLPTHLHVMLIPALLANFVIGGFFMQQNGGSNTFNFLVNVFIFGSIYTTTAILGLDRYIQNRVVAVVLGILVILITVPRAVHETSLLVTRNAHLTPFITVYTESVLSALRRTPEGSRILIRAGCIPENAIGSYVYLWSDRQQYVTAPPFLHQFGSDTFDRERNADALARVGTPSAQMKLVRQAAIDYILLDNNIGPYIATASAYGLTLTQEFPACSLYRVAKSPVN